MTKGKAVQTISLGILKFTEKKGVRVGDYAH